MTEIGDFTYKSYFTLPHIYLDETTGKGFAPRFIGLYDRTFGITNPTYVPGKFVDDKGGTEYKDDDYRDKHAIRLVFKHKPLGNWPILRNIGEGHFHERWIVSKNEIDPFDVMREDEHGNIVFKANLLHDPPHTVTMYNNIQLTLIEIEPYGTPEDLEKLAKDARFMATIVQDNKVLAKDAYAHRNQNKLLLTRVAGAGSTILLLQDKVNSLLQHMEAMQDQFVDMQLEVRDRLSRGIKDTEGKYNLSASWDKVHEDDISKTIASIKSDIRKTNALIEADGILTDSMKQLLFTQVVNILSPDYMSNALRTITAQPINTPKGTQIVYQPETPTPTQEAYTYMQQHAEGRLSDEQLLANIRSMVSQNHEPQTTPNAATQKVEERPIVIDTRGRPVQYPPR